MDYSFISEQRKDLLMSSDPTIISFRNVSKSYNLKLINSSNKFRDSIGKPFGKTSKIEALRNIELEIHKGEKLGIIGKNGSGKSTLLKILCKITPPDSGEILVKEQISAMLEVGAAFHLELTGEENVLFNGSILRLSNAVTKSKLDEIFDFSELQKFRHVPLKKYSTGMRLRLAFSIAAILESGVIILDEILNIGDKEFQGKAIHKMNELNSRMGSTILIVSHNLSLIRQFCSRVIWIHEGRIKASGDPSAVLDKYIRQDGPD